MFWLWIAVTTSVGVRLKAVSRSVSSHSLSE